MKRLIQNTLVAGRLGAAGSGGILRAQQTSADLILTNG